MQVFGYSSCAGDVLLYEVSTSSSSSQLRPGRRIATAHDPLATCVRFRGHKPWELVTGGVDCRVARWDFSKGRSLGSWNMSLEGEGEMGKGGGQQMWNPPMVHGVAVPRGKGKSGEQGVKGAVAVARGDGVVSVLDVDGGGGGKGSGKMGRSKGSSSSRAAAAAGEGGVGFWPPSGGFSVDLRREEGGHTKAVACVEFLNAGGGGRWVASGGEDKSVIVWDWARPSIERQEGDADEAVGRGEVLEGPSVGQGSSVQVTGQGSSACGASASQEAEHGAGAGKGKVGSAMEAARPPEMLASSLCWDNSTGEGPLVWKVAHGKKVNALQCLPHGSSSEMVVVADTSRVLSLYMVQ